MERKPVPVLTVGLRSHTTFALRQRVMEYHMAVIERPLLVSYPRWITTWKATWSLNSLSTPQPLSWQLSASGKECVLQRCFIREINQNGSVGAVKDKHASGGDGGGIGRHHRFHKILHFCSATTGNDGDGRS